MSLTLVKPVLEYPYQLTLISTKYTGSNILGSAVSSQAYKTRLVVGMIWPPPLWMASAWSVTS